MRNFKSIADDVMSGIYANEELKRKTLARCRNKRQVSAGRFLVPAACLLLVIGILNISNILPPGEQSGQEKFNIMAGSGEGVETLPAQSGDREPTGPADRLLKTVEEAKDGFGSGFLTPSYIPEGFEPGVIRVLGPDGAAPCKVVLEYTAGGRSFLIIEERSELQGGFDDFKNVDINGVAGYIKTGDAGGGTNEAGSDIELHWFRNGVHYSVLGLITEDEAVNVALAMK